MKNIPKFKISLAEIDCLKDSINILNDMITEPVFSIQKNRIEIICMDPANVAMAIWKLLDSACIEYDVKEEFKFSIHLPSLVSILKNAKKTDIIVLTNSDDNYIGIHLKGTSLREYKISLIDYEEKEQKIPDLQFKTKIKLQSALFYDQIKEICTVADSVIFNISDKLFEIKGEGDLNKIKIANKESDDIQITTENNYATKYSVEYLLKITKCKKIGEEVTLEFNKDYPLKLSYKWIDKLSFEWILAPRVAND